MNTTKQLMPPEMVKVFRAISFLYAPKPVLRYSRPVTPPPCKPNVELFDDYNHDGIQY